ncbi:eukaryotic translation initiation factor 4 gamma 2 isoform X2 [Bradysia coprophila]|nr:eukaryotic translation initiation factor 4 gamma 2 isoform X2 [Bradysia coprophila]XP_037032810.1 eukaryotic translation initiation factor 4 gamma 2 isoform X2 [Bradysia coprophila]XP_037032811.1 eukaryotic translation initiation factor 4 gamma 2 isoform X2 [Bradysia coprophila]
MYAQLCKRLSVEAPILKQADNSSEFLNLLLNVCRDRFLNRQSVNHYNHGLSTADAEDDEKLHIAKQKMLGNVKFIGELYKLDMLQDNILHKCIQQLLCDKDRSNTIKDRCEDMECLSQLIRTCGKDLDSEEGKKLIDQYFVQITKYSQKSVFPPRIRFMLRDVIELRRGNWVPRKVTNTEGPVPMQQLQLDDDLSSFVNRNNHRDQRNNDRDWLSKSFANSNDFNGLSVTSPSHYSHPYQSPMNFSNRDYRDGGSGGGYRHMNQRNNQNNHSYNNHNRYNKHNNQHNMQHNNMMNNKEMMAPRLKRNHITPIQENVDDNIFRPAANSLIFKASVSAKASQMPLVQPRPSSASSIETVLPTIPTVKIPPAAPVNNILNKDQILIKQASLEKPKQNKKDKGPTKDEILVRVVTFLTDNFLNNLTENERNIDDIKTSFLELKVPDKFMRDAMTKILNEIIDKNELVHDRVFEFLVNLRKDGKLNPNAVVEGFRSIIGGMSESVVPRIATLVASLLSRAITLKLCKINDVAAFTENGQHYPLCLLVLQQLNKTIGKQALTDMFNQSKVNLMTTMPEPDRSKERMAEILVDRSLSFLYPLLKLQGELQKQIQADSNPNQLFKWIKDNVDVTYHSDPGFITALMTVLLKHITQESTLADGIDAITNPDKSATEKEKQLLENYRPVLIAFLRGNYNLQLVALFAVQVFCYSVDFPKGMLLRWFKALYDLSVIEEESFMRWKEDLTDIHPGKGESLFQVNKYLTWMEQAESEDDDDDDEEEAK